MKKALLIIVLLLSSLFYAVATNYEMIGINNTNGFVLDSNDVKNNLYQSNVDDNVELKEVFASEGIYKRLNTIYYGDENKVKTNSSYPMFINDGAAVKLLSGNESLITSNFEFVDAYSNLILNDGSAFNNAFERSDFNDYILIRLTNNLYVNTKDMFVDTYLNHYRIPANSIIYFVKDRISYYSQLNVNTLSGNIITDIDDSTVIRIGDVEIPYSQLLINLGEVVEYHQQTIPRKEQDKKTDNKENSNTSNNDNKSSGDKPDSPQKPSEAPPAKEPEPAEDTPSTPVPPDPYIVIYEDWELPEVKMGSKFNEGVYSLEMNANVKDYAGVIYGGLVFEIFDNQATVNSKETISKIMQNGRLVDYKHYEKGTIIEIIGSENISDVVYYKVTSASGSVEYFNSDDIKLRVVNRTTLSSLPSETVDILIKGLTPESHYLVSGYFKCKDKYDRPYEYTDSNGKLHTQIDFLTPKAFSTKTIKDLGNIVFAAYDTDAIFGDRIQIGDVGFDASRSDVDAIASLSRIQYKITSGTETIGAGVLQTKQFDAITQLQKINFTYRNGITSNNSYFVEFRCFDKFGNELTTVNNTVSVKTCKKLPIANVVLEYSKDEQGKEVLGEINLTTTLDNPDGVTYSDLRYIIFNSDGTIFAEIPCVPDQAYKVIGLGEDKSYTLKVYCKADVGDGTSAQVDREIYNRKFTTSPISLLGDLYLSISNATNDVCPDEKHRRVILDITLSDATNSQLIDYVDFLSVHLTSDSGISLYEFTSEDLEKLLNNETIRIDSDKLQPPGLMGITKYQLSFTCQHFQEDGSKYTINVSSSLKQFTTTRTPATVLMTTPVTAPGYINTTVKIEDPDDFIEGESALLKIYEINGDSFKLVSSYVINKNQLEYQQIIMSSDPTLSTDGISYTINQDSTYRFIFKAEANTETGTNDNYTLAQTDILINIGVKGDINLRSLETYTDSEYIANIPNAYQQLEYLQSTGKEYIDTGLKGKDSLRTIMKAQYTTNTHGRFFGERDEKTGKAYVVSASGNQLYVVYGSQVLTKDNFWNNNVHIIDMNKNVLSIDGTTQLTFNPTTFESTTNFQLFGTAGDSSNYSALKVYYCEIYDDDTLVRKFVPVRRIKDGILGMYDTVTGHFFTNAGTGAFTTGGNVVDPSITKKVASDSYLSTINIDMIYPEGWLGSKDFYVTVNNNKDGNKTDVINFTYNEVKSTATTSVYDLTSTLNNGCVDKSVSLTYNADTKKYSGSFRYIVDRIADKNIKYTFNLETALVENAYLINSIVNLDKETYKPTTGNRFTADIDINAAFPDGLDDYSFFVNIFNKDISSDIEQETLYFKYDELRSDKDGAYLAFYAYRVSDLDNPIELCTFNRQDTLGTNSYKYSLNYTFTETESGINAYSFTIYRKIKNDLLYVPLDSTSFSTETLIYTISNIDEFLAVKGQNRKYVVIADIEYTNTASHSETGGPWGSTVFNAQIDFQGYTLTYTGYNNLIYNMSKTSEITNMVYKTTAYLKKNSSTGQQGSNNRGAGSLVSQNYGRIANVTVEYTEMQPEDIKKEGSSLYLGYYYWSDETDHDVVTSHRYSYLHYQTTLAVANYGTIENFAIDVKTNITAGSRSGIVCVDNYGTVKNGYVYSSNNPDNKANVRIYRNGSYSSNSDLNTYNSFGLISGRCCPTGTYAGVIENVYALGNINNFCENANNSLGIVCGYNSSIVKNTFSNGNVLKNKAANASYGPTIGYFVSPVNRNPNNNYMSSYSYNNSYNHPTSTIALRSPSWVNDVLNTDGYHEFNVEEMIAVGCYPQVNMPDIMPSQPFLELPELPRKDEVDVLYSEVYKFGIAGNEELDRIINEKRSGNDLGDLITGKKGETKFTSDSQIVTVYVSDKTASQIYGLHMSDTSLCTDVLLQTMDGTGVSVLYMEVYNPSTALSTYHITGLYFKNYDDTPITPATPIVGRDLEVSYVKLITTIEDWKNVINNPTQNHRLGSDLDFAGVNMKDIFINATFSGVLDGQGYTIKNIEYDSTAFKEIFPTTVDGSNSANIGLIKNLTGKVKNLTIENANFEGGQFVGVLAASSTGAIVDNVYVKNSYAAGTSRVAGLIANMNYSDITNSGVINTKLISVGGQYNTANDVWKAAVGGLVAYVQEANNIVKSFTNNIYIEHFTNNFEYDVAGGAIGFVNGQGNLFEGVYATGTINSNGYAAGGLIGMNISNINANYCYADVDVNSYFYNAAGLVGVAWGSVTSQTPLLSFGDVHSQTKLENSTKNNAFKILSNKNSVNGKYFNKATLMSDSALTPSGTSFDINYLNSDSVYNDLGPYYDIRKNDNGVAVSLPKLKDSNGNLLPNQLDTFISPSYGDINVTISEDTSSGTLLIDVTHPNYITIDNVYTDYRYINELIDVNHNTTFKGVKSLTNKQALNYRIEEPDTNNFTHTQFILSDFSAVSYYDYYNLTALKYSVRNRATGEITTDYLKINQRLNSIKDQFKVINNLDEYTRYVAPSIAENFIINADIDFGGQTANYYDEKYTNIIVNRLIGAKVDSDDYLYMKDNGESQYYTISNLKLNGTIDTNQKHGFIYSMSTYMYKAVLSEIRNITFENININAKCQAGIVGYLAGNADNFNLINDTITTTTSARCSGFIGFNRGPVTNIYVKDFKISSQYCSAVIAGITGTVYPNNKFENIYLDHVDLNCNSSYCGGVIGRSCEDYSLYSANISVKNITVNNSTFYGSSNSIGGVAGRLDTSAVTFDNCNVYNSSIKNASQYLGAIVGCNNTNGSMTMKNSYVYKCYIQSTYTGDCYVGGITGYQSGNIHNTTVEDCTIIANGNRVGGITGYCNSSVTRTGTSLNIISYEDTEDQDLFGYVVNTKIYGKDYVGGAVGYGNDNMNRIVVVNDEIKGNRYVGGIAGANYSYYISQAVVSNCTITPWKDASEAIWGPAYSSDQQIFGGICGNNTRMSLCIVENSFIGGENVTYCGGLQGAARFNGNSDMSTDNSCENCIVIGKTYVGGLFGIVNAYSGYIGANYSNSYSNAHVYGNDYVGGIAGYVVGCENKDEYGTIISYSPMPIFENLYFTGTLTSKNNVAPLFGMIKGNTEISYNMFRFISSFPSTMTGKKVSPLFGDLQNNTFAYKFKNLINDASPTAILLAKNTNINLLDTSGNFEKTITMYELIKEPTKYSEHITNDISLLSEGYIKYVDTAQNIKDNFTKGEAGDPFIALYSSKDDYKNNFYIYSTLDTNVSSAKTKYIRYRDMSEYDFMPMTYTNATTKASETIDNLNYYRSDGENFIGNRYHTIKNPFVEESKAYKYIRVQQGVGIPGSTRYNEDNSYMASIYDLYLTGGLSATGLGVDSSTMYQESVDYEPVYRKTLDSQYKQVEYIYADGNQYINTEYIPSNGMDKTRLLVDMTIDKSGDYRVHGVTASQGVYVGINSSSLIYYSDGINNVSTSRTYKLGRRIIMDLNGPAKYFKAYYTDDLSNPYVNVSVNQNTSPGTYPLFLFTYSSGGKVASAKVTGRVYAAKIYDSGELVRDFIPVQRVADEAYGLYDMVHDKFYENKGSGKFTGGNAIDENYDFNRYMYLYPSSVSTLNLELDNNFVSLLNDFDHKATLTITDSTDTPVIEPIEIDTEKDRTYSFDYDFNNTYKMTVTCSNADKTYTLINNSILNNTTSIISSNGYDIYYIIDGKLYSQEGLKNDDHNYINLYHGEVLDSDGNVYDLSTMDVSRTLVKGITPLDSSVSIYSLNYSGKDVKTYGTYSVVDSKYSDTYRIFKATGNLVALSSNTSPVYDPLFARYSETTSTIVMLSNDKKVYSIGTNAILTKLEDFNNDNIVAISTNIHDKALNNNPLLAFVYGDGSIVIYDVDTGKRYGSLITTKSPLTSTNPTLGNFLKNTLSLDNLFGFTAPKEEKAESKKEAEQVSTFLVENDISLNDAVDFAGEEGDNFVNIVSAIKNTDSKKLMLTSANNESEPSDNDSLTPSDNETPSSVIMDININNDKVEETQNVTDQNVEEKIVDDDIEVPEVIENEINVEIDGTSYTNSQLITDKTISNKQELITVYNGDTDEFDIIDVDELLENPEEVVAENIKVVDKSTLKALYNQLGESKDNTTRRGIIIYSVIAIGIILLLIPVAILRFKYGKKQ